nr:hypothetical protein [Halapricum sp. CBA1109]
MSETGIDSDIDRDVETIEEDIDRNAGYDHEAASEIQTSIAKLEDSSVEVAERADYIKDMTAEQYQGMDKVADEISNLSAAVEEVASSTEEVSASSQEAERLANGDRRPPTRPSA